MRSRSAPAIALAALALALGALWLATRFGLCHPRDPIAPFERAVERAPDDARARLQLGRALVDSGRSLEARPHLERALALGVDSAEARVGLALAYEELGHYPESIEHARAALRLAPEHADATLELARILATCPDPELRDLDEALRLAEGAGDSEPAQALRAHLARLRPPAR